MLIVVTSVTVGLTRDGLATQLRSHAALASGEVAAAVDMRFRAVEGLVMMLANLQTQMRCKWSLSGAHSRPPMQAGCPGPALRPLPR